jgi:cell division protein FtsL
MRVVIKNTGFLQDFGIPREGLSARVKQGLFILLIALVFVSALGVIYVKDLNRRLFIQYQVAQHETSEETVRWGKLLADESAWSTESRVQAIAKDRLHMRLPLPVDTMLVTSSKR